MKQFFLAGKIVDLDRMPNSLMGNPRWRVWLEGDGVTVATTQTNAPIGYQLSYTDIGSNYQFKAHYTRAGALVIDGIY